MEMEDKHINFFFYLQLNLWLSDNKNMYPISFFFQFYKLYIWKENK